MNTTVYTILLSDDYSLILLNTPVMPALDHFDMRLHFQAVNIEKIYKLTLLFLYRFLICIF